jgi:hypothetical protein
MGVGSCILYSGQLTGRTSGLNIHNTTWAARARVARVHCTEFAEKGRIRNRQTLRMMTSGRLTHCSYLCSSSHYHFSFSFVFFLPTYCGPKEATSG